MKREASKSISFSMRINGNEQKEMGEKALQSEAARDQEYPPSFIQISYANPYSR